MDEREAGREPAKADEPGARVRAVLLGGGPFAALTVLASVLAARPLRDVEVVLHRGLDGEPTRTGSATELLVVFPALGLMTFGILLLAAYGGWRPSDGRPPPSTGVLAAMSAGVMGVLAAIQLVMLGDALGWVARPDQVVVALLGGFYVLGGWLLLWERTATRAHVMVNLPMGSTAADRRRVGRTCGRGLLTIGLATLAAQLLGPAWLGVAVLAGGSIALTPILLVSAARSRRPQHGG